MLGNRFFKSSITPFLADPVCRLGSHTPAKKDSTPLVLRKSQAGFTIAETLVGAAIFAIVALGIASSMDMFYKDIKNIREQTTRSDISANIRTNAKDYTSFYNSAQMPTNKDLSDCLNGTGKPCESFVEKEFVFYSALKKIAVIDSSGNQVLTALGAPLAEPEPIGGISDTACTGGAAGFPVFYTLDGRHCNCEEAAQVCPIQVISKYMAICKDTSTCAKPAGIKLNYQIKTRGDVSSSVAMNFQSAIMDSGQYFMGMDQQLEEDYYVKFLSASSYNIDLATGKETINSAVSEYDIQQGKVLTYTKPASIRIDVSFRSPDEVASLELLKYTYPTGCTVSNLGQTVSIMGTSVDCTPRPLKDYKSVQKLSFSLTKSAVLSAADNVASDNVIDYRMITFNASGAVIKESSQYLRAFFKDTGFLSVTTPTKVIFACTPTTGVNEFTFIAKSFSGWSNIKAKMNPGLLDSAGKPTIINFPGFDKFDTSNPNPQILKVDPKYFVPGGYYEITFEGTTNDGVIRQDKKGFYAAIKPAKLVNLSNPSTAARIRTKSDLNVQMTINLGCEETPADLKFGITTYTGGLLVMPETDMGSTCVKTTGAVDQNKYLCTKTFTCAEWLNLSSSSDCPSKFPVDTLLYANAKLKDSNGALYTNKKYFTAGSRISTKLAAPYVQNILFQTVGINLKATTQSVTLLFSAALLAGEKADFSVTSPGGIASAHSCGITGSVNAVYNGTLLTCILTIPIPTDADILTINAVNTDLVTIGDPNVITVKAIKDDVLSCDAMPTKPVCPAGQTLKRKIDTLGIYNFIFNDSELASGFGVTNYLTLSPEATVDFFVYYRPTDTALPTLSIALEAQMPSGIPGVVDTYKSSIPVTNATTVCTPSPTFDRCPGDWAYVDSSYFAAKKAIFGASPVSMGVGKFTADGKSTTASDLELFVVRQCYCQ